MSEDIHSLLGKYFSGQASEEETAMVKQWTLASKQNAEEFEALEKLWNRSEEQEAISFDTEKAWQKVNTKISTPAKGGKLIGFFKWKAAIAVAALFVLVLAGWWLMSDKSGSPRTITADINLKEVRLPDGSKVHLRKGATLTYNDPFKNNTRDVVLTGEAFFDVTPDATRPFLITAGESFIRVVGTSFSVDATNKDVELIVKTGKVNFGPLIDTNYKMLVTAGERAVLANSLVTKGPDIDVNSIAWMTRKLVFNNTPFSEVVKMISDYYKVTVTIKKEDIKQISNANLSASFEDKPLSAVFEVISMVMSYQIREKGKDIYEISIK